MTVTESKLHRGQHLLEVRNLGVDFKTSEGVVHAVRDVSFHVDRGETLAILGESGSGKSVSSAAIMGLIDMPPGRIASGEILFDGQDLLTITDAKRREINGRRIAMIFQDPLAALNPVYSVGWQTREALAAHHLHAGHEREIATSLFEKVGIPDPALRGADYPHQFSGGQRQRVMIAMAIATTPDLLIADEPTTALDVTVQAQILALLKRLQAETGMGLILITHDLGVATEIADRVVVMQHGEVVEAGKVRDVLTTPRHPYTQRLVDAMPGRHGFPKARKSQAQSEVLIEVRDLVKEYGRTRGFGPTPAAFRAVDSVNLSLHKGETLAIVGESGSGKSTLARTLLGLDQPTSGQVLYRGKNLEQLSSKDLFAFRRRIQVVFQDPTASLNPFMNIHQIISEPWTIHRDVLPKAQWKARVGQLLERVGLSPEHALRYPHQFSGGQRQRIAIARAMALEPEVIVCDEAVSSLDVSVQAQIIELLDGLRRDYRLSFLFIAHDLPVVREFADRVLVMRQGKIIEEGLVADVFDHPQHPYTRELLAASLSLKVVRDLNPVNAVATVP